MPTRRILLLAAALALAMPLAAQQPADPIVHRIDAPALGRAYELIVSLPPGYAANPHRRYPVLYTTDAARSLPLIRATATRLGGRRLEDFILVGLGMGVGDTREYSRRRDYTPSPNGDIDAVSDMPGRPVVYGEAEGYRRHIEADVFPFIDAHYRTDPARRLYIGHSYGGLFGAHVLLTAPTMFQRYVLISPSLWYDRRLMLARERGYATRHRDLPADVYFLIGSEETVSDPDSEPFSTARHAMVEDMAAMVAALAARAYPSLYLRAETIPGSDHAGVYPLAVPRALEWALPAAGRP